MSNRRWYVADALMADLTSHQCKVFATSEEDALRKMSKHYPGVVAILMLENPAAPVRRGSANERGWKWSEHIKSRSKPGWMWSERVGPRAAQPSGLPTENK
jgi:hypothetical protein